MDRIDRIRQYERSAVERDGARFSQSALHQRALWLPIVAERARTVTCSGIRILKLRVVGASLELVAHEALSSIRVGNLCLPPVPSIPKAAELLLAALNFHGSCVRSPCSTARAAVRFAPLSRVRGLLYWSTRRDAGCAAGMRASLLR